MHTRCESSLTPLTVALTLRELRRGRREHLPVLRSRADGQALAVIDTAARRVYSKRPLEFLVDTLATGDSVFDELGLPPGQRAQPSARLADASFDRLCWLFGARLAREDGLAPWIRADQSYKLLCWPDFGAIGNDPLGIMLCTLLAENSLNLAGMIKAAQLPHATVYSLVNSLALCNVLVPGPARPVGAQHAVRDAMRMRPLSGVIQRLWQRCGVKLQEARI